MITLQELHLLFYCQNKGSKRIRLNILSHACPVAEDNYYYFLLFLSTNFSNSRLYLFGSYVRDKLHQF